MENTRAEISRITKEVQELRPRTLALYGDGVLSLVYTSGVHVTEKLFFGLLDADTIDSYKKIQRTDTKYPYEYSLNKNGIVYFCLGRHKL